MQLICENEQNALYRTLAEKYKISIGSVSNPMAEYITVIDFNIKGAQLSFLYTNDTLYTCKTLVNVKPT